MNCPPRVGGARVVCFSPIDERHRPTGNTRQLVHGELLGPAAGIAIAQYDGEPAFYLFGCDDAWQARSDTWHQTLDEAKAQAEFEYLGVTSTWVARP
jgi:hypothetical protein